LHLSQPAISRDIDFIRNQTSSAANREIAQRMCYEQQNGLDDVGELMKNLWLVIDNPKIEVKERMKGIKLMLHCYYMRLKLVDSEAFIKQFSDLADKVKTMKRPIQ
jgi:hypothetical protein